MLTQEQVRDLRGLGQKFSVTRRDWVVTLNTTHEEMLQAFPELALTEGNPYIIAEQVVPKDGSAPFWKNRMHFILKGYGSKTFDLGRSKDEYSKYSEGDEIDFSTVHFVKAECGEDVHAYMSGEVLDD